MIYQIDISKRTRREIEQLPGHMRQRIKREIAQLAFNLRPTHAVALRGPTTIYDWPPPALTG